MLAYSCIMHVENVDQEYIAVEEEAAAEDQEGQQLQEVEDQVEEQDPADLANPDQQPGKHRFIYPRVLHSFKFGASIGSINPVSYISLNFSLTLLVCAFKLLRIASLPRCMRHE